MFFLNGGSPAWWLRSSYATGLDDGVRFCDDIGGFDYIQEFFAPLGIRPAFWVDLL